MRARPAPCAPEPSWWGERTRRPVVQRCVNHKGSRVGWTFGRLATINNSLKDRGTCPTQIPGWRRKSGWGPEGTFARSEPACLRPRSRLPRSPRLAAAPRARKVSRNPCTPGGPDPTAFPVKRVGDAVPLLPGRGVWVGYDRAPRQAGRQHIQITLRYRAGRSPQKCLPSFGCPGALTIRCGCARNRALPLRAGEPVRKPRRGTQIPGTR
jgi:hypothetical protein